MRRFREASEQASTGPQPPIPEPTKTFLPTVNIATAKGWPEGAKPTAAQGLTVTAFANGFDHPRWLYVLPNGDVLVAETNAPERPEEGKGIKGWIMQAVQKRAGAGVPSANRITLLRDADGDGVAETRTVFLKGLNSPIGMALIGHDFYVANTDAVMKFAYEDGATQIHDARQQGRGPAGRTDQPSLDQEHHRQQGRQQALCHGRLQQQRRRKRPRQGRRPGLDPRDRPEDRAAAHLRLGPAQSERHGVGARDRRAVDRRQRARRALRKRSCAGLLLTSVKDGGFYGWPYSYWGQHVDDRVKPQNPEMVAKAIAPDYGLGNHTARRAGAYILRKGRCCPEQYRSGAFVGQHGSWNRKPRSGYKVIFVPFANGKPAGEPKDVLTGFVKDDDALGRPVEVAIDKKGALLVADDVGNTVWRVAPSSPNTAMRQ